MVLGAIDKFRDDATATVETLTTKFDSVTARSKS